MLNLYTSIHLHEIEAAIFIEQKLESTRTRVTYFLTSFDGDRTHFFTLFRRNYGRRSFLQQFLVATLDRAFAFAEMNHIAVFVGQNLYLYVPRTLDITLDINGTIFKRHEGLGLSEFEVCGEIVLRSDDPHSASATARRRLNNYRETDLNCEFFSLVGRFDGFGTSGQDRDPGCFHCPPGLDLIAHHSDHTWTRPDKFDVTVLADLRKRRGFSQKPVTRVNGVNICDFGGADDSGDIKIALGRRRRTDTDRLVGEPDMQSVTVRL